MLRIFSLALDFFEWVHRISVWVYKVFLDLPNTIISFLKSLLEDVER